MDRVKIQEQREVWLRASAALKAREAEQAHAVRKHADEVERATKRVAEEREKLDAMIADTQAQLEKLGAVPEEAEVAAAGSTIGEALPEPEAPEAPTGEDPEAVKDDFVGANF